MTPITKSIRQLSTEMSATLDLLEAGAVSGVIVTRRGRAVGVLRPATDDLLARAEFSPADPADAVTASDLKRFGVSRYVNAAESSDASLVVTRQNRPVAVLAPIADLDDLVAPARPLGSVPAAGDKVVDNSTPLPAPDAAPQRRGETDRDVEQRITVCVEPTHDGSWRRVEFAVPAATFETREAALASVVDAARSLDVEFDIDEASTTEHAATA